METQEKYAVPYDNFSYEPINSTIKARMLNKSYKPDGEITLDSLVYVTVKHYNFNEQIQTGELVVNKCIADDVLAVFKELFDAKYPIEKLVLIDEYDANDDNSMADNNSSAFNYRTIAGTKRLSNHALGLAIDINPLYNPYVQVLDGKTNIYPEKGAIYVDREGINPFYIHKGDVCYNIFLKHGFTWGGDWSPSKDYQHFEHK